MVRFSTAVFIDKASSFVDLSFLETESIFLTSANSLLNSGASDIYLVTEDIDLVNDTLEKITSSSDTVVHVIWNIYRCNGMARALYSSLKKDGHRFILLSHSSGVQEIRIFTGECLSGIPEFTDHDVAVLSNIGEQTFPIPVAMMKKLQDDLKQLEALIEKNQQDSKLAMVRDSKSAQKLENGGAVSKPESSDFNQLLKEHENLQKELSKVQKENEKIQKQLSAAVKETQRLNHALKKVEANYGALAASRLGSITLKHWERKRNKAK